MKRIEELIISRPPWKVSVHNPFVVMDGLYQCEDEIVKARSAQVHNAPFTPKDKLQMMLMENDARLIAAAPELYAALHEAVVQTCLYCKYKKCEECKVVAKWRAALAKASGEEVK